MLKSVIIAIFLNLIPISYALSEPNYQKYNIYLDDAKQLPTNAYNYDEVHNQRYLATLEYLENAVESTSNGTVLEIGFSNKHNLKLLKAKKDFVNFFGIGGDPFTVDKYIHRFNKVTLEDKTLVEVANVNIEDERLPFAKNEFDLVLSFEVFEHMSKDPMYSIMEINRVLKPNGKLILTTPNITSYIGLERMMSGNPPYLFSDFMMSRSTNRHNKEWGALELKLFIENAGFKVIDMKTIDVYHKPNSKLVEKLNSIGASKDLRGEMTILTAIKQTSIVNRFFGYFGYDAEKPILVDTNDEPSIAQ